MNKQQLWMYLEELYEENWGGWLTDLGRDTFLDPDLNIVAYVITDLHRTGIKWQDMTEDQFHEAVSNAGLLDLFIQYIQPYSEAYGMYEYT